MKDFFFRQTIGRLSFKSIGDGQSNTFFDRYLLIKTPFFSVYLHRFYRGDHDRCLHDHPWSFLSIILRGGYWEEMFVRKSCRHLIGIDPYPLLIRRHWRRPGSILWRPAKTAHRIDIEPGTRPWSLVIVGRKVRDWGFWTTSGWQLFRPGRSPACEES